MNLAVKEFKAGGISKKLRFWQGLTHDQKILDIVQGYKIELNASVSQTFLPSSYKFSEQDSQDIDKEITLLLSKGIIVPCTPPANGFVSNIFVRRKKNGSLRVILDLKRFNEFVTYHHFKMEGLQSAINLMTPNCYMASIDWKDAYHSVSIHPDFRKFLTFCWKGAYYYYACLPNGLASAPRIFTKLTKVLFSHLRRQGVSCVSYIDDCLLVAENEKDCQKAVLATIETSLDAGFTVQPDKSVLNPTTKIEFLGFILDSVTMTVRLTKARIDKILKCCEQILCLVWVTIRQVAELIGLMVSSFQGVELAPLYYRQLDIEKVVALKLNQNNFDASMQISQAAKSDILWWYKNVSSAFKPLVREQPAAFLSSDASKLAWGGFDNTTGITTGGYWSAIESRSHINCLEIMAALFTLKSLARNYSNQHVRIYLDNTTAVSYINRMGGRMKNLNSWARKIWIWCCKHNIWLSAAHLPGVHNIEADLQSRSSHDNSEWCLNKKFFDLICQSWGVPDVDLFASRLNFKVNKFVSWKPDPYAFAVDAFSLFWGNDLLYIFPPFALIGRILQKICNDQAEAIMIVPFWPTQVWFAKLGRMLINIPFLFPRKKVLSHPIKMEQELPTSLRMMGCRLSGKAYKTREFREKLKNSSWHPGGLVQRNSTPLTSGHGWLFRVDEQWIRCHQV